MFQKSVLHNILHANNLTRNFICTIYLAQPPSFYQLSNAINLFRIFESHSKYFFTSTFWISIKNRHIPWVKRRDENRPILTICVLNAYPAITTLRYELVKEIAARFLYEVFTKRRRIIIAEAFSSYQVFTQGWIVWSLYSIKKYSRVKVSATCQGWCWANSLGLGL